MKYLQKALDKSDRYIADLEQQNFCKKINEEAKNDSLLNDSKGLYCSRHSSLHSSPIRHFCSPNCSKIIKTETQNLRNVKFSDKVDTIKIEKENKINNQKNLLISPSTASFGEHQHQQHKPNKLLKSSSAQQLGTKQNLICSPIKSISTSNTNSPFKDRLNAINSNLQSIVLEIPSPLSQSQISEKQLSNSNENSSDVTSDWLTKKSKSNEKKVVDFFFEKPSFNREDTFNITNYCNKKIQSLNDKPSKQGETCMKIKQSIIDPNLNSYDDENDKNFEKLLNNSTSEFKDCLKLLNMAEKKVNRIQLSNKNIRQDYILPGKYSQSNNNSNEALSSMVNNTFVSTNNCGNSQTTLSSSSYLSTNNNAFSPSLYEINSNPNSNSGSNQTNFSDSAKNEVDLSSSIKINSRTDSMSSYKSTNLSSRLKKYSSLDQNLNYVQTRTNKKLF